MLLVVRCYEPCGLGTCRFHAGGWPVLVHSLLLLAILALKPSKASGPSMHCSGLQYHFRGHGTQRNYRCPAPRRISRLEQVIIWLLVQLLHRVQPRHPFHVLVWDPGEEFYHYHSS